MAGAQRIRPTGPDRKPLPAPGGVRSVMALSARPLWREHLVWVELASLSGVWSKLSKSQAGRPRSVVLIPGFMTGDRHLAIMRRWLEEAGHTTECAGIRFNVDCSEAAVKRLEHRLEDFSAARGQRVVLIGQSRGGLFARVLAVRRPDLVESIVTLGSPHLDPMRVHPAVWLQGAALTLLGSLGVQGVIRHSCRSGECCAGFRRDLRAPFTGDVAFFSVYSRKDGIVDWRACLDDAAESVEIESTHCGMALSLGTYHFLDKLLNPAAAASEAEPTRAATLREAA